MSDQDDTTQSGSQRTVRRRNYLKAIGAAGLGVGLTQTVSGENSGQKKKEIVMTRSKRGPELTRTVPTAWYKQTQRAKRVADTLKNRLLPKEGIASVSVGTQNKRIGNLKAKAVNVGIRGTAAPVDIPDHVDGIPVHIEENVSVEYLSGEDLDRGQSIEGGTITSRCYDGTSYVLTVKHLLVGGDRCPSNDIETWEPEHDGTDIGYVEDWVDEYDIAWIEPENYEITGEIVSEPESIAGWVTSDGLDTAASNEVDVQMYGQNSGQQTLNVESTHGEMEVDACDNLRQRDVVRYRGYAGSGDSGAPIYWKGDSDGDAWMCSPLSGAINAGWGGYMGSAIDKIIDNTVIQDVD